MSQDKKLMFEEQQTFLSEGSQISDSKYSGNPLRATGSPANYLLMRSCMAYGNIKSEGMSVYIKGWDSVFRFQFQTTIDHSFCGTKWAESRDPCATLFGHYKAIHHNMH